MKTATACVVVLLTTLTGCASNVKVTGDYPTPLIESLPVSGGLILDEAFKNYTFQEDSEDRWSRTIILGESQSELLRTVLPSLFDGFEVRANLPESFPNSPQIWFHPTLLDFQYATPRETRMKLFEVWIKYQVKAYDNQGQQQADWIVTAYGKTPSAFMKSEEEALNAAIVVALRDLGANLSLQTKRVPEINDWLRSLSPNR